MASGRDAAAGGGTRAAALGADGGQLAAAQQAQGLAETKGQAVPLAAWRLDELAVLRAARPGALGPGLVATLVAVFFAQPRLGVDALDQAPLNTPTTGGRALAPGPHHPLRAGLRVAGPGGVGPERLVTEPRLRAGHQPLLLAATAGFRALPPGRRVPAEAGLGGTQPAGSRLGRPGLAVEGPQRLEVPCVHTLHVPHRGTTATAAGALTPVARVPGGTGPQVAAPGGLGPASVGAVLVPAGAAAHGPPGSAQAAGGGALAPVAHLPAGIPGTQQVQRRGLWGSAAVGRTVLSWRGQQHRAQRRLRAGGGSRAQGSPPGLVSEVGRGCGEEGPGHCQCPQVL